MNVKGLQGQSRPVVSIVSSYQQASEPNSGSALPLWSQRVFSVPAWISTCSPEPEMKTPHCPQECQPPLSDLLKNKVWNTISSYPTIHQTTAPYSLKGNRLARLYTWLLIGGHLDQALHSAAFFCGSKRKGLLFCLGFFWFFSSKEWFFIHPLLAARNNTAFKN